MDFAMAASQNGVCITQQMCHEDNNIVSCQLWENRKYYNFLYVFFVIFYNFDFFMTGKLVSPKSILWRSCCKIHRYIAAPVYLVLIVYDKRNKTSP